MNVPSVAVEPARAADAPAIAALLRAADLPHEDIGPHLSRFIVARNEVGEIVGAIGAEVHAPDALLRSLVVAAPARGAGLGGRLVRELETAAVAWGVQRWWLLTTTAADFFRARGFVAAARSDAPPAIRQTGQFSGGCCSSAVCLTRERRAAG